MRPLALAALALLLPACAGEDARSAGPTPAEQMLLAQITRDRFVLITATWRDPDGHLVVETEQGRGRRTYVLAPAVEGGKDPLIRRRIDDFALATIPAASDRAPILQRGREP